MSSATPGSNLAPVFFYHFSPDAPFHLVSIVLSGLEW